LGGLGAEQDGADLCLGERDRAIAGTKEAGDARRILDHVPKVVVEFHLDQYIAGQEDALDGVLFAITQLSDGLGGNHDAAAAVLQAERLDAALERLAYLTLKA